MEPQTVFLDEGGMQRSKLFLGYQFVLWVLIVYNGIRALSDPDGRLLGVILLISSGPLIVVLVWTRLIMSDPDRRPRIIFQEDGLVVKRSYYRKAQEIGWNEILSVDLKPNAIEIYMKDSEAKRIRFEMVSYAVNQKMKDHFRTYVAGKLEAPVDSLPEQRF